jgi:hypothetical protein
MLQIEGVIIGRNDDYEPGWANRLRQCISYNHQLCAEFNIDYRVVFVEWNPPAGRPLLAPGLVADYPFVRGIVCDAQLHGEVCHSPTLQIMLAFGFNPGVRTSVADYVVTTTGDTFWARDLVSRIAKQGLRPGCLYRAERVNIDKTLDFSRGAEVLEDPSSIISIDSCSEPPFNQPPFTNACGDFLMVDRRTALGLRGFDEGVRNARLHLDSRFCETAMAASLDCELLGRIFHINHARSYTNMLEHYPDEAYDASAGLPTVNLAAWGLADHPWRQESERLWHIAPVGTVGEGWGAVPTALSAEDVATANAVTSRLIALKSPERPLSGDLADDTALDVTKFKSRSEWNGGGVEWANGAAVVEVHSQPWGYSAYLVLASEDVAERPGHWRWIRLSIEADGPCAIGLVRDQTYLEETMVGAGKRGDVFLPCRSEAKALMIRNAGRPGGSRLRVTAVSVVTQLRQPLFGPEILLS